MKPSELWSKALTNLTDEEQHELLTNISEINVCMLPRIFYITKGGWPNGLESFFTTKVARRSEGRYAVIDRLDNAYNAELETNYENIPSERTDEFKAEFRHDFLTALRIAEEVSWSVLKYFDRSTAEELVRDYPDGDVPNMLRQKK